MFLCQSAGQSATPASTRTSARAAEPDSTFTWANARRAAPTGWSAAMHRGSVFPVSAGSSPDVGSVKEDSQTGRLSSCFQQPCIIYSCHRGISWCIRQSRGVKFSHRVFAECPAECESCVNSETCTRCRPGLYQLSGRCHHVCPEDYEPNDKLMECAPQGQRSVCASVTSMFRRCSTSLFSVSFQHLCLHSTPPPYPTLQCTVRSVSGASGAPALGPVEPVASSGARRPAHDKSSSSRRPSVDRVPPRPRPKSAWSREENVQVIINNGDSQKVFRFKRSLLLTRH